MASAYPPIKPYATHNLPVATPHQLYVEECGNPNGVPILLLHGGPGSGCTEDSRRFFDPNFYRIILFDQRGCGRSTPYGELQKNTTQALIDDIETIRVQLNIDKWIVFGGSWGSTLSLLYAQSFPQRVSAMILASIFLNQNQDMDWLYGGHGANRIYPEHWEDFLKPIPLDQRHNPIYSYYNLLTGNDELARMNAAKAWSIWEAYCSTMEPNKVLIEHLASPHIAITRSLIECHYFVNNCFIEPNQILREMPRIQHIPATIIHGRYDMICPFDNAWKLHKAWPISELIIINNAGHSFKEPGIMSALIHATQKFINLSL